MRREDKERKRPHEQRKGGQEDQQRKSGTPQDPRPGQPDPDRFSPDRFSKNEDDENRAGEGFERGDETSQRSIPRPPPNQWSRNAR